MTAPRPVVVAITGATEKVLRCTGVPYRKVYVHPAHHAGYYPGVEGMLLRLLFTPDSGKILGAQAVGGAGVDKRTDVLAVALQAGVTVSDLEELELAYAPQFGSVNCLATAVSSATAWSVNAALSPRGSSCSAASRPPISAGLPDVTAPPRGPVVLAHMHLILL